MQEVVYNVVIGIVGQVVLPAARKRLCNAIGFAFKETGKMDNVYGKRVIEVLAKTYQQLYIAPGEGAELAYAEIVSRGSEPEKRDLSHFCTHDNDMLVYMDTPAGKVLCVTLYNRADFVTFLRIMANRCTMATIPDTQGASMVNGVINWSRIKAHKELFFETEQKNGNLLPDWSAEFKRFTSDKNNYKDTIIVLSVGPYSNLAAEKAGYDDEAWLKYSDTIRKFHECTHVIYYRLYPECRDAVLDELVADAVGIYAAFGKYSVQLAGLFLGIENGKYVGGRLENYIVEDQEIDKTEYLCKLTEKIMPILEHIEQSFVQHPDAAPFEMADVLKETYGYFQEKNDFSIS